MADVIFLEPRIPATVRHVFPGTTPSVGVLFSQVFDHALRERFGSVPAGMGPP